jgi:uncharacterized protein YciI
MYFLGTNKINPDSEFEKVKKVIPIHIKWTKSKIQEGKIVQAGKWGEAGGMAIFKAETLEEAKKIFMEDPLIESGLVFYELARFYPDVRINKNPV